MWDECDAVWRVWGNTVPFDDVVQRMVVAFIAIGAIPTNAKCNYLVHATLTATIGESVALVRLVAVANAPVTEFSV